jgi:hypothetical protein
LVLALFLAGRGARRLDSATISVERGCPPGDCLSALLDASPGEGSEAGQGIVTSAPGGAAMAIDEARAPQDGAAWPGRTSGDSIEVGVSGFGRALEAGLVMVAPRAPVVDGGTRETSSGPEVVAGAMPADGSAMEAGLGDETERAGDLVRGDPAREAGPRALCGTVVCAPGEICCNRSCGICTMPGAACTQQICGIETLPISAPCGPNTCNVGQVCCNPSCGICVPPGATCDQRPCESPKVPFSVSCGLNTCNVGEVCCNPSCGICAMPGQPCRSEPCP